MNKIIGNNLLMPKIFSKIGSNRINDIAMDRTANLDSIRNSVNDEEVMIMLRGKMVFHSRLFLLD